MRRGGAVASRDGGKLIVRVGGGCQASKGYPAKVPVLPEAP